MRLKIQKSMVDAGRPIDFLPVKSAQSLKVRVSDRVEIAFKGRRIIAIVDIVQGHLRTGEISLSREVINYLDACEGDSVNVSLFLTPKSTRLIAKKLNGSENLP